MVVVHKNKNRGSELGVLFLVVHEVSVLTNNNKQAVHSWSSGQGVGFVDYPLFF